MHEKGILFSHYHFSYYHFMLYHHAKYTHFKGWFRNEKNRYFEVSIIS